MSPWLFKIALLATVVTNFYLIINASRDSGISRIYQYSFAAPPNGATFSQKNAAAAAAAAATTTAQSNFAVTNALEKIKARNAYLCQENTDKSQWGWKTGGPPKFHQVPSTSASVISLLQPSYTCPWTLHRTNYVSEAPNFDGGKWTCGLKEMKEARTNSNNKPCVVYSFGSNGDDFFEANVLVQNPNCEIHIFDPTSGAPPESWKDKYHFHASGLCVGNATSFSLGGTHTHTKGNKGQVDTSTYKCQSLQGHMKQLGHEYVDIFKADVEGMEWELTKEWGLERSIGQILLEFHFWVKSPSLPELLKERIIPLEKLGYFIHTLEPVAAQIDAYEITLLNVNWNPDGIYRNLFHSDMYPSTPNVVL